MHLVGFIIEIYYDAWSYKHQILFSHACPTNHPTIMGVAICHKKFGGPTDQMISEQGSDFAGQDIFLLQGVKTGSGALSAFH